jgi:imidazolonepropionase-like amidohydrolase
MKTCSIVRITAALLAAAVLLPGQGRTYVLKAARLFDGTSNTLAAPALVAVANGKIQSVGGAVPPGAMVIDLGDATLLPGFIDAHTHLTDDFNSDYSGSMLLGLQRTIAEKAIRATANARVTLLAGFTTVRNLGASDFLDVGLRNAINAGVVPGPRMLISVNAIGSTAVTAMAVTVIGTARCPTRAGRKTES